MGIVTQDYIVDRLLSDDAEVQRQMFRDVKQATGTLGNYVPRGSRSWYGDLNIPSIDVDA